ncbi:uncharacterized protein F5Z01DRAFT_633108 [Emericellopsis atlantica]|uniref:VWFA domain-containing protein n=1 Tax=Emericellopsis atlantica TaxID=2614577 RepID=A0A9P7ZTJ8_9HYPO|nr:uncharacterized protein F5Z01DRAFT_633108 [Emericellopsis atlantica]KAG9258109.1 hypothetical protein F5Z01DRAFT_633108 [Emericellopsis atlantica]
MSSIIGSFRKRLSKNSGAQPDQINTKSTSSSSTMPAPNAQNPFRGAANLRRAQMPTSSGIPSISDAPPPAYDVATSSPHGLAPPVNNPPPRSSSPTPSQASRASRISHSSVTNDNDQFAFLTTFDTVFLVDDSSSMTGTRWKEARSVLSSIADICAQRDKDGIDLYFLNHNSGRKGGPGQGDGGYYNITSGRKAEQIFNEVSPRGGTPTGIRLRKIMKPYLDELEKAADVDDVKPVNIIVITDGEAHDEPGEVIKQVARKLDRYDAPPYQMGVQFFQVGNDPHATEALRELDDDLGKEEGIRDMVDTATWSAEAGVLTADGILKVVLGAVVKRLDRQ